MSRCEDYVSPVSWDISIMDLPSDAVTVEDIPQGFKPGPLGLRADLIARITEVAPMADFSDPSWGQIETPEFVVDVNIGREEVVDSIMLHVRGGGAAPGFVADLVNHLGRRALDSQTGEFFAPDSAHESFAAWRAFRDRVVGSTE